MFSHCKEENLDYPAGLRGLPMGRSLRQNYEIGRKDDFYLQ